MSSTGSQNVCFLVGLRTPVRIESLCVNPGIGGTEFTDISLAIQYARLVPCHRVYILATSQIDLPAHLRPGNLTIVVRDTFLRLQDEPNINVMLMDSVLIAPQAILESLSPTFLRVHAHRIIATIRHPNAKSEILKDAQLAYYVAVGSFQYKTISDYYPRPLFIQNVCNLQLSSGARFEQALEAKSAPRFVYLGALVPAKGFHLILSQWATLKRQFPLATLDVIGGSETYGISATHSVIPTIREYAEQLEGILQGNYDSVRFHGNLGAEKEAILDQSHIALLNPTGRTEAFPASPLQCMARGLPVVASDRLGMRDCMQYFPELALTDPSQIPCKVQYALGSSLSYQDLSFRSRRVAEFFSKATDESLLRWKAAIESVLHGKGAPLRLLPSEISTEATLSAINTRTLVRHMRGRVWGRMRERLER